MATSQGHLGPKARSIKGRPLKVPWRRLVLWLCTPSQRQLWELEVTAAPGLRKEEEAQSRLETTVAGPQLSSWESGMNKINHGLNIDLTVEEMIGRWGGPSTSLRLDEGPSSEESHDRAVVKDGSSSLTLNLAIRLDSHLIVTLKQGSNGKAVSESAPQNCHLRVFTLADLGILPSVARRSWQGPQVGRWDSCGHPSVAVWYLLIGTYFLGLNAI